MRCAYHQCSQPVYVHGVCAHHLVETLAAGHRASTAPSNRMRALLRARYGKVA